MPVTIESGTAYIADREGRIIAACSPELLDDLAALPAPTQEPGRPPESQPEPTFKGKRMAQWKSDCGRRR